MKEYIGSQEHWEDSVNADYDRREEESKYQEDNRDQPYPLTQAEDSEDEMWQEVKETFDAIFNERYTVAKELYAKLKQHYSITRKIKTQP